MAGITTDASGSRRIQFYNADRKKLSIRLPTGTSMKAAESFKQKVEALISDLALGGIHNDETTRWLRGLGQDMLRRLERVGLSSGVGRRDVTLEELFKKFKAIGTVKQSTAETYQQGGRTLIEHFGAGRHLRTIGPLEADEWRQWMVDEGWAEATISKRVKTARQAFKKAVKWRMISENPFTDVRAGSQTNKARMRFVSRETIQNVLDACPDAEWRLIVVLSRYGGLRCPSEHLGLRWTDVDWDGGTLLVHSPKTEHHDGGASRLVPLFPELRRYLREAFDPENTHVITRHRQKNCNLRTQFQRILARAGIEPWPKLFHNLRSTRQTELTNRFPAHVVCAWLGNSEDVARGHYLQVTDAHFAEAAQEKAGEICAQDGTHTAEQVGGGPQPVGSASANTQRLRGGSGARSIVPTAQVTPAGTEQSPRRNPEHDATPRLVASTSKGRAAGCAQTVLPRERPPIDAIPEGGAEGALARLADGTRRLCGGTHEEAKT